MLGNSIAQKERTDNNSRKIANQIITDVVEKIFPFESKLHEIEDVKRKNDDGDYKDDRTGFPIIKKINIEDVRKRQKKNESLYRTSMTIVTVVKENKSVDIVKEANEQLVPMCNRVRNIQDLLEGINDLNDLSDVLSKVEDNQKDKTEKNETFSQIKDNTKIHPLIDELINRAHIERWIHFDKVEVDKLQWLQDIPSISANTKPSKQYEARFNWQGELLPFMFDEKADREEDQTSKDIDLYFHGGDPHRPGYTLQELFRLARSQYLQQRHFALKAIVGIVEIYQRGYYDKVIDLPITNIFFLLRCAMDDDNDTIIEIAVMGLALIFYNESDEALFDVCYENNDCHIQPITSVPIKMKQKQKYFVNLTENSSESGLQSKEAKKIYKTTFDENECSLMSDSEIGKSTLMECLIRTSIIQRIYYILHFTRPENSTPISCFKLLIAIAHSDESSRFELVKHKNLLWSLVKSFLPSLNNIDTSVNIIENVYNYPQHLVLKLFRVLLSTEQCSFIGDFMKYKILDIIEEYIRTTTDLNVLIIKIHIESFRILKCLSILRVNFNIMNTFQSSLLYYLNWHYNHLVYEDPKTLLLRQHAAALLNVICNNNYFTGGTTAGKFIKPVIDCCSKWLCAAKVHGIPEITCSTLLCKGLESVITSLLMHGDKKIFYNFCAILSEFMNSSHFADFLHNVLLHSIIFNTDLKQRSIDKALSHMGSIVHKKDGPAFIFNSNMPHALIHAILLFKSRVLEFGSKTADYLQCVQLPENICTILCNYICAYQNRDKINFILSSTYFTQIEIRCIASLLQCKEITSRLSNIKMYHILFNFMSCLPIDKYMAYAHFVEESIFTSRYIEIDQFVQENWSKVYDITLKDQSNLLIVPNMLSCSAITETLSADWLFHPLLEICRDCLSFKCRKSETQVSDHTTMLCVLKLIDCVTEKCPTLVSCSPSKQLMFYMMMFLSDDTVYLDKYIGEYLRKQVSKFLKENETTWFDFDCKIDDICFEMIYVAFLEEFESCSYSNVVFSSLLMIPLAQKYDIKWRQRVWSEYVVALRYVNCDETMLIGGLDAYRNPIETNALLLKSFRFAIAQGIIHENSISYKIADHHLKCVSFSN